MTVYPPPTNPGEAFRAGVRCAPFCAIDSMSGQLIVATDIPPGPNEIAYNDTDIWTAIRLSDLRSAYRVGRALRRIGQLLDALEQPPIVGQQLHEALFNLGMSYLTKQQREDGLQPYDEVVLVGHFFDLTAQKLIEAETDPSDLRRLILEYARHDPS